MTPRRSQELFCSTVFGGEFHNAQDWYNYNRDRAADCIDDFLFLKPMRIKGRH